MMMNRYSQDMPMIKRLKSGQEKQQWVRSPRDEDKDLSVWRFVVGNIGTLPSPGTALGSWKIDAWRDLVMTCDVNILTEINKDMMKVKEEEKIESIAKGWWQGMMVRTEFLIEHEYVFRGTRQQGGVAMIANGIVTSHIMEQGGDKRKLGRWRWMVCRGKHETKTCIIGCYKPGETWVAAMNQSIALQRK